jgi:NitT/TauT family transport system ATP-binding protein
LATSTDPIRTTSTEAVGLPARLDGVRVSFGAADDRLVALDNLTLDVPAGSFTAVIGPNGCGKSTLLRVVAGLLTTEAGTVVLGSSDSASPPVAGDGRVGLAFQQPRLVPWLTTLENVVLPLSLAGVPTTAQRERALEALARVGLRSAARLRPRELSGGLAQRAGLARALIQDPPLLLLDEPFSALDALTREAFDAELERLWLEHRRTVILVTHDVAEAIRLADRIVVMTPRPGAVATLAEVELPRPRPADLVGDLHAAEIDRTVREALAGAHPPELAPWTATP